jgi:hypothetical protein
VILTTDPPSECSCTTAGHPCLRALEGTTVFAFGFTLYGSGFTLHGSGFTL